MTSSVCIWSSAALEKRRWSYLTAAALHIIFVHNGWSLSLDKSHVRGIQVKGRFLFLTRPHQICEFSKSLWSHRCTCVVRGRRTSASSLLSNSPVESWLAFPISPDNANQCFYFSLSSHPDPPNLQVISFWSSIVTLWLLINSWNQPAFSSPWLRFFVRQPVLRRQTVWANGLTLENSHRVWLSITEPAPTTPSFTAEKGGRGGCESHAECFGWFECRQQIPHSSPSSTPFWNNKNITTVWPFSFYEQAWQTTSCRRGDTLSTTSATACIPVQSCLCLNLCGLTQVSEPSPSNMHRVCSWQTQRNTVETRGGKDWPLMAVGEGGPASLGGSENWHRSSLIGLRAQHLQLNSRQENLLRLFSHTCFSPSSCRAVAHNVLEWDLIPACFQIQLMFDFLWHGPRKIIDRFPHEQVTMYVNSFTACWSLHSQTTNLISPLCKKSQ